MTQQSAEGMRRKSKGGSKRKRKKKNFEGRLFLFGGDTWGLTASRWAVRAGGSIQKHRYYEFYVLFFVDRSNHQLGWYKGISFSLSLLARRVHNLNVGPGLGLFTGWLLLSYLGRKCSYSIQQLKDMRNYFFNNVISTQTSMFILWEL